MFIGSGLSDTERGDSTCKDTEDENETDHETGTLSIVFHLQLSVILIVKCIFQKFCYVLPVDSLLESPN